MSADATANTTTPSNLQARGLLPPWGVPDDISNFAAESLAAVFKRGVLSPRDRRLLTIATLTSMGSVEPLRLHTQMALEAGLSKEEIYELILHVGFYAGFGRSTDAFNTTKDVLTSFEE